MAARSSRKLNEYSGSTLDDFLSEEGILDEVSVRAYKRLIAMQIEDAMLASRVTKSQLAERMLTSRSQLDRILDPDNASLTLESLDKLARALGRRLSIAIE